MYRRFPLKHFAIPTSRCPFSRGFQVTECWVGAIYNSNKTENKIESFVLLRCYTEYISGTHISSK